LASYARTWERFTTDDVSVAGISVDPVVNNRAMVEKLLLPFPLLSDPEGRVIKAWGVWTDGEGGIARPTDDELFDSVVEVRDMARGDRPLPLAQLEPYMRGAKFAALALGKRHQEHESDIAADAARYVEMAERYRQTAIATFRAQRERGAVG
jgi:hypothetical protein